MQTSMMAAVILPFEPEFYFNGHNTIRLALKVTGLDVEIRINIGSAYILSSIRERTPPVPSTWSRIGYLIEKTITIHVLIV